MRSFKFSTLSAVFTVLAFCRIASAQGTFNPDVGVWVEDSVEEVLEFLPPINRSLSETHVPRVGLGHDVGEGIGFDGSFTTFEGFIPLFQESEESLLFADLRLLLDNESLVGANVGLGSRRYLAAFDRSIGLFFYYDVRQTGTFTFQQLSVGFDLLGDDWDFRTNVYLPGVIDDRHDLPNLFRGNSLFVNRNEAAMSGLDMEIGLPVPVVEQFTPKVFGGWYHFQEAGRPQVWGWRIRAEAHATELLSFDISVQNDQLFETTVNFGVALRFPASGLRDLWPPARSLRGIRDRFGEPAERLRPRERLAAPVERLQNIVVDDQESIAIHATTGQPFFFLHVASIPTSTFPPGVIPGKQGNAASTLTGSFEAPFATLADVFNSSRFGQGNVVVYDRTGGSFTGNVSLANNSQLRSNGPVQRVNTQFGSEILPFSGADPHGTNTPTINGSITLADNTTLSGFTIVGQGTGPAVRINGGGTITIFGNTIRNTAASAGAVTELLPDGVTLSPDISQVGIFANGTGADVSISSNTIETAGSGILLAATGTTFNIDNNTISLNSGGNQANAIDLRTFNNASVVARLRRNTISANATDNSAGGNAQTAAINLQTSGTSELLVFVTDNNLDVDTNANGANGISNATGVALQSLDNSEAFLLVDENTVDVNAFANGANGMATSIGSSVNTTGNTTAVSRISRNSIDSKATATGAGGTTTINGSLLSSINDSKLTTTLNNNTITSVVDAVAVTTSNTANSCLNATSNALNPGAGGFGFRLTNNAGTLRVVDRDNLGANNDNATVNLFGTITSVTNCD